MIRVYLCLIYFFMENVCICKFENCIQTPKEKNPEPPIQNNF